MRLATLGVIMLIHGGGWTFVGHKAVATEDAPAAWWHSHGYVTREIDYRPGAQSVGDVIAAYDKLRKQFKHARIIADGQSAGGTLALLLGAYRPTLNGVISEGGVADLRPRNENVRQYAALAFGAGNLWKYSPVRVANRIHMPVLAAGSVADNIVNEPEQLRIVRQHIPQAVTMLLKAGNATFIHAGVTDRALARFRSAELRLAR